MHRYIKYLASDEYGLRSVISQLPSQILYFFFYICCNVIAMFVVANVGVVTQARGSAYMEMGQTKVICAM